jgi:hypothetical protein
MDTHLIVPIRSGSVERYENTWMREYSKFILNATMLIAKPEHVLHWRQIDEQTTGRKRDLSTTNIAKDQNMNIAEFRKLVNDRELPNYAKITNNVDGERERLIQEIANNLKIN